MSSNLIKIIAAVFVVLAFILAFVAYRMSHDSPDAVATAQQAPAATAAPATPQHMIVVAARPLFANQPIDKDAIKLVGTDTPPKDFYGDVRDVEGLVPTVDIDIGAPLTPRLFDYDPVAKLVPAGFQAVSLTLTDVIGVGGFVRFRDVVDVVVYLHNDTGNKVDPAQARILLKNAMVLAVDQQITPPPSVDKSPNAQGTQPAQQQQQRHERSVVIAVPDAEVPRVMLGASLGDVRLSLHGKGDDQSQAASATAAAPPADSATVPPAAAPGTPTEVSGGSLTPAAAAKPADADQPLPDLPITSAELARLKPVHPVSKSAPQGIVIYRGNKASTVYP
jgi:pilus assembly protein CpaB